MGDKMNSDFDEISRLYGGGKYSQALSQILELPQDAGDEAEAVETAYYAGLASMRLKRYEDALGYLEQVVTSGSSLDRVRQCRLLLAVTYAFTGRESLADYELKKLLDAGYKMSAVYSALAFIAWEQKRDDEAIGYYEAALKEDDSCVTALNGLGYVLAALGRELPRALSLCKRAVSLSPSSAACLDSLGLAYFKLGLTSEAKACLKKAKERDGENEVIQSHYSAILMEEKNVRENAKISDSSSSELRQKN
jgi:tetratricopeptide (TPR) repeat protein